jgi:hypothetical protein
MIYVEKIAKEDQRERRNALLDILRNENIPFIHYNQKHNENWVENIVVSINPSDSRLVICAHYDSIMGSTGANDNAAGVSVLLHLTMRLLEVNIDLPIDILFSDREEYVNRGSEKYIKFTGKEKIVAMINLDTCGFGDNICISAKNNEKNVAFRNMFSHPVLSKHNVHILGFLPSGDDKSFDRAGIPNISISMLPKNDIVSFTDHYENYIKKNIKPTVKELEKFFSSLEVMSTMHNGSKDKIESISQQSIDKLVSYLYEGIIDN